MDRTLPQQLEDPEAQTRQNLADLYRLVAHFRMTDLIDTHISARVPDTEDQFFINRYGVLFNEMRPEDLVKIDAKGKLIDKFEGSPPLVNAAGFTIHSAIHMARHDLICVIHTHTADGIAVSSQVDGLLPISQHALKFYGCLAYHDYEGLALDLEERERLALDLGPSHQCMILRNHGLLAAGRTIPEAFHNIYSLERACQAQVKALTGGRPLVYPPESVRQHTAEQFNGEGVLKYCEMAWQSALRLLH